MTHEQVLQASMKAANAVLDVFEGTGRVTSDAIRDTIARYFVPLCDDAKDAEIARLRATAVQECKAWKDALLASEMENLREENRRLTAERDAAVKRAEDAEFSQAAMQEVVATLIKAFAGIDVLIRNGDEDGIVQRFADAEKAMDAVVGKPSEAASAIRSRLAAAEKVVEAAQIEANQSIAYASHWRTRQALAALDAAKEAKP